MTEDKKHFKLDDNTFRMCLAMVVILAMTLVSLDAGFNGEILKIAIYSVVALGLGEAYLIERRNKVA